MVRDSRTAALCGSFFLCIKMGRGPKLTIRESAGRVIVTMIGLGVRVWCGRFGRPRGALQIPPLRYTLRRTLPGEVRWPAVPPLRYASVMTLLFGKHKRMSSFPATPPRLALSRNISRRGPLDSRSLHSATPDFHVELGGVGALHAPFLYRKAHTRPCLVLSGRNPGTLQSG